MVLRHTLMLTINEMLNSPTESPNWFALHLTNCRPFRCDGDGGRRPCMIDTFNPHASANSSRDCQSCPSNARTSVTGAADVDTCLCNVGFYRSSVVGSIDGFCQPCPLGARCREPGITFASLPLELGWWRASATSVQILRCPDSSSDASACRGGEEGLCANGTAGPYCRCALFGIQTLSSMCYLSRGLRICRPDHYGSHCLLTQPSCTTPLAGAQCVWTSLARNITAMGPAARNAGARVYLCSWPFFAWCLSCCCARGFSTSGFRTRVDPTFSRATQLSRPISELVLSGRSQ